MTTITPPSAPPPRKDLKRWRRTLIRVGVLLLFGGVGCTVAACGGAAPAGPAATSTPRPTATPANPNASAPAYTAAVVSAVSSIGQAWEKFSSDCNQQDVTTTVCRDDLQAVHDAVASGQSTLSQHPAPPCLKAVDARVREALTDYHDGITLIQQGVQDGDTGSIQVGSDLLSDGNNELAHAQAEIHDATC